MNVCLYKNPIWHQISMWADRKPNDICVQDTSGRCLTYQELVYRVNAVAIELVKQGFQPDDRAFFLARPSIESIVYFLAVLRAGGVIVAADVAMGRESFRSRFELVSPKWMVLEPVLFWVQKVPLLEGLLRLLGVQIPDTGKNYGVSKIKVRKSSHLAHKVPWSEVVCAAEKDALIVFTSGTTALPKGVVHTYASISATLDLIQRDLKPTETDRFYASQLYFLFIALLTGASAVLPRNSTFRSDSFAKHLVTYGITKAYLLPAECEELILYYTRAGSMFPVQLKSLMLGSAPCLRGFLTRLKKVTPASTNVLCIYGSTEMLPICSISMVDKLSMTAKGDILGRPFTQVDVRIDKDEIVVSGPNLCRSYCGGDLMSEYRTGDLGVIDEKGGLILMGRKKDMIIKGNYNIYPTLFESVINGIRGVRQCALVGIYNEDRSDEEIILVVEKEIAESDEVFRSRLSREMASGPHSIDSYAMPDKIYFMELPLSGRSLKVDKKLLRDKLKILCGR